MAADAPPAGAMSTAPSIAADTPPYEPAAAVANGLSKLFFDTVYNIQKDVMKILLLAVAGLGWPRRGLSGRWERSLDDSIVDDGYSRPIVSSILTCLV